MTIFSCKNHHLYTVSGFQRIPFRQRISSNLLYSPAKKRQVQSRLVSEPVYGRITGNRYPSYVFRSLFLGLRLLRADQYISSSRFDYFMVVFRSHLPPGGGSNHAITHFFLHFHAITHFFLHFHAITHAFFPFSRSHSNLCLFPFSRNHARYFFRFQAITHTKKTFHASRTHVSFTQSRNHFFIFTQSRNKKGHSRNHANL